MLFYLCEKADLIRIGFCMLGIFLFVVLNYLLVNREFTKVSTRTIVAICAATVLCFVLFVLLPESDLAFELCRRAGITF